MTRAQREKAKAARQLPWYVPSKDELKWYRYCVDNAIRISPIGTEKPGEWYIGISDPSNYKKVYNSKHKYDKDTLWVSYYEMCKFYYDKQ